MFSSDELLASPLVRNMLSPEEVRLAEADENWLVNDGMSDAKIVFTLSWDSSMPGSCGASWINEWRGLYFFTSSDLDPMGPFTSLEEALGVEYLLSFFDSYSIDSDVTRQARRPLIRIGRIGPFSRQAHFLRVWGARLIAAAASLVGKTSGRPIRTKS